MVLCPECETDLDVDEEGVDEGEVISCPECGTDFEVVTTTPLELKAVEAGYEEDEEEEVEESEDGDFSLVLLGPATCKVVSSLMPPASFFRPAPPSAQYLPASR